MRKVIINNKEYAYGDIEVLMFGQKVWSLKGINYKLKKEKGLNYGAGRDPRGVQHGKRGAEGDVSLGQSDVIALNAAARAKGFRDFLDVDLDFVVSYIPEYSTVVTVDFITCASFSEIPMGMKEGDLQSEHSLPFVALGVDYDVTAA
jgi:hypothetical protein